MLKKKKKEKKKKAGASRLIDSKFLFTGHQMHGAFVLRVTIPVQPWAVGLAVGHVAMY